MKILVDKSFERDVKRLPIQVQKLLKEITQKLSAAYSLGETNSSKMEGAKMHTAFDLEITVWGFT